MKTKFSEDNDDDNDGTPDSHDTDDDGDGVPGKKRIHTGCPRPFLRG